MVIQCNKDHQQTVRKDTPQHIQGQEQMLRPPIIVAQPVNTQDHNLHLIQEAGTNTQGHRVHQAQGGSQAVHLIREVQVAVTVALQAVHPAVPHEVVHPAILHLQEAAPQEEDLIQEEDQDLTQAEVVAAAETIVAVAVVDAGNNKMLLFDIDSI
jgi:hypothetical protein